MPGSLLHPVADGFKIQIGTLLSGSAKIESKVYRDQLIKWCGVGDLIGGEMEGVGLLSLGDPGAGVVVKGICDYAEDDQRDEVKRHRANGCANAAKVVIDAIRRWDPSLFAV